MDDSDECCYNVRLEYRYQRYGTLGGNELGFYVRTLKEYVFDAHDVLVTINDYDVPHGGGDFFSEQTLAQGRYTAITIGNKGDSEQIDKGINENAVLRSEEIGVTKKGDLLLRLNNPQGKPEEAPYAGETPNIQGRSNRLYYGYRNFEVGEFGVTRVAVDMTHTHCVLGLSVIWADASGHLRQGEVYTFVLQQTHTEYHFMPEFLVSNGLEAGTFNSAAELFPQKDRRRINYIPEVNQGNFGYYTAAGAVTGRMLYGQFITFRYRNDSQIWLSIWSTSERVMKPIDLVRFFHDIGIDLDHALWQEYDLQIEINGDEVRIGLVRVDDWEDRGEL
jgi:hypothetical protein